MDVCPAHCDEPAAPVEALLERVAGREAHVETAELFRLLGDPTREGARPEDVFSPIDFDGDPQHCADYPPPQRREDIGECVRPGVPPPP